MNFNTGKFTYIRIILFFVFFSSIPGNIVLASNVEVSFSSGQAIYFTPDKDLNKRLQSGEEDPFGIFGVSESENAILINPSLQEGWTWLAVKDISINGKLLSYFFVDGWIFTNHSVITPHRRQKFKRNVTDLIQSNVFALAFYSEKKIEKELVIFIASERDIQAELKISKELWGEEKTIIYPLEAGQGHFISVLKMTDEYRPNYISEKKVLRERKSLNKGWKFLKRNLEQAFEKNFNDTDWEDISVPHCWNKDDVYDTRNVYDGFEIYHGYYRGIGWYRNTFTLDKSYSSKSLLLHFEGVNQTADVWLNGIYLGNHMGGYTGFSFDITGYCNLGEEANILAVKVDNSYRYDLPPHTADFIMYGGLYRDVRLHVMNNIHIQDQYITSPILSDTMALARIQTEVRNEDHEESEIILLTNFTNADEEIVATSENRQKIAAKSSYIFDQTNIFIKRPHLWNPEDPYLYSVHSTVYKEGTAVDEITEQFGFRWFRFDAKTGFYLNGQPLKLRGVNKHQDFYGLGNAVPDSLLVMDIQIIKDMGANFLRLAHYPHDPSVLEACDRLGLLVWEEIPLVNSIGGEEFNKNTLQMMREMILRDRNHPSIILWGITNESAMRFANKEQIPKIKNLLIDLHELTHKTDPSRLTVHAHNHLKDISLAGITDIMGRNRYFGWYEGNFDDFNMALDEEQKKYPDWKIVISEYGVGSKLGHHVERPAKFDFSEDYQCDFHEHYLKAINDRPWIAGSAVWAAFDFGSFVKVGNIPRINQKGLCDMSRNPKDAYYFYQSQWSGKPMIYIVSHTKTVYSGKINEIKPIRVYSNCDDVELFLNGNSLGRVERQYVFRWNLNFVEGKNQIKAVGRAGNNLVEDKMTVIYRLN